jgi:hypothetical protein
LRAIRDTIEQRVRELVENKLNATPERPHRAPVPEKPDGLGKSAMVGLFTAALPAPICGVWAIMRFSRKKKWRLSGAVRVLLEVDRAKAVELALLLSIAGIGVGMLLNALWLIIAGGVGASVLGVILVLR